MRHLGKIIRRLREDRGLSQSYLARTAGISNSYMNCIEMENEHADNVGFHIIDRIAKALDTDVAALLHQSGDVDTPPKIQTLPVLATVNAAPSQSAQDLATTPAPPDLNDPKAYAVLIGDDSMSPIQAGSLAIVSPRLKLATDDLVVVKLEHDWLLRKLQIDNAFYILSSTRGDTRVIQSQKTNHIHKVWGLKLKT